MAKKKSRGAAAAEAAGGEEALEEGAENAEENESPGGDDAAEGKGAEGGEEEEVTFEYDKAKELVKGLIAHVSAPELLEYSAQGVQQQVLNGLRKLEKLFTV